MRWRSGSKKVSADQALSLAALWFLIALALYVCLRMSP